MNAPPSTIGRRHERHPGPKPELVLELSGYPTPDIGDVMPYAICVDPAIAPIAPVVGIVAGPALTVSVPTGSKSVRRAAFEMLEPGAVLVIAGYGLTHFSLLGGQLAALVAERRPAAVIIDGCARDFDEIVETKVPVFCRGSWPVPPGEDDIGEINVPVACGGVAICPGDVVVADRHGILVVALDDVKNVLGRLRRGAPPHS